MLSILNNGVILGRHGVGGAGGIVSQGIHPAHYHGKNGYPGGAAIVLQNIGRGVLITNNNTIGGGGGPCIYATGSYYGMGGRGGEGIVIFQYIP